MRSRALLVLAIPALVSCGRIKSFAKRVIRGREPTESQAPPVNSGPAAATPIKAHPRIWLDTMMRDEVQKKLSSGEATWTRLDEKCAARMAGPVEWPDGKDYPSPGIGEGYQGSDYWEAVLDLALCSVALKTKDPARSKALSDRAADVLEKMSEIAGPHAVEPLRDDGFGIRFYVTTMAIGYDWLHADLSPALKERLRAAMARWLETYDVKGFARDHPQGNYFAGYYAAKAFAALATQDDEPKSPTWWADWYERMHKQMVQPYYAKHLVGGGWPEGWSYGALGTLNMTWPVLAAHTAKDINLFRDPNAGFTFPFDQAIHLVHFAWPDRIHVDDRGENYESSADEMSTAPLWTLTVLPSLLRRYGDPFAPQLQKYAREIRGRKENKAPAWMDVLFWDAGAPEADYEKLQTSYVAWGMQTAVMRSNWDPNAVWATFTSGAHTANAEGGHMHFDQGSLAIVRGSRAVLVNAASAVRRREPGDPQSKGDDPVYEELFGNHDKDPRKANRTIFNVFYARSKPAAGQAETEERYGQIASMPPKPKTKLARFEDRGEWVLMRGEHLEDMYRKGKKNEVRVASWTRQVLYVRPSLFVVDDRTEVGDADLDQWLAFHFPSPLTARAGEAGLFDVHRAAGQGPAAPSKDAANPGPPLAATVAVIKPDGAPTKMVDVYDRHRVMRIEVRPAKPDKKQRWLTVIDAAPAGPSTTKVKALEGAHGATIEGASGPIVVLSAEGGTAKYRATVGATHYVTDLAPKQELKVSAAREGDAVAITVDRGAGLHASQGGVLAFRVEEDGRVVAVGKDSK